MYPLLSAFYLEAGQILGCSKGKKCRRYWQRYSSTDNHLFMQTHNCASSGLVTAQQWWPHCCCVCFCAFQREHAEATKWKGDATGEQYPTPHQNQKNEAAVRTKKLWTNADVLISLYRGGLLWIILCYPITQLLIGAYLSQVLFITALMLSINILDGSSFLIGGMHHCAFKDYGACKYITLYRFADVIHAEQKMAHILIGKYRS